MSGYGCKKVEIETKMNNKTSDTGHPSSDTEQHRSSVIGHRTNNKYQFKMTKTKPKYLKLSILALFCIACCITSTRLQAQRTPAVLTFNDSTVKTGLGKLTENNTVKFKISKKEKAVKYKFSDLKQATIGANTYMYVNIENKKNPKVLERVLAGKVYLYRKITQGYMPTLGGAGQGGTAGVGFGGGHYYNIKDFYVRKMNETHATHLGSNQLFTKNFKKAASDYFEDCPELVKKIQDRTLKKKDLRDIVLFYNNHCD